MSGFARFLEDCTRFQSPLTIDVGEHFVYLPLSLFSELSLEEVLSADVAQWQSSRFVIGRLEVQLLSSAPVFVHLAPIEYRSTQTFWGGSRAVKGDRL